MWVIHTFRKDELKTRSRFSKPLILVHGHSGQSVTWQLRAQGGTRPGWDPPWTGHPSIPGPHSDWDNVDTSVTLLAHLRDVGGKQSPQEKTKQTIDEGRMCKFHTNSGPGRKPIFFLINIITKGLKDVKRRDIIRGPVIRNISLMMIHHHLLNWLF